MEITKRVWGATRFVNVTEEIVFEIIVRNKGPCDATNVNVTEVLSPHLKMISNGAWIGHYDVN